MERTNGKRCGAKKRGGGECQNPAGWGTDYSHGPCKKHGGLMPGPRKAAIKAEALAYAAEHYGTTEVQPTEALLMCVRDAAGMIAFYKHATAGLEPDDLLDEGKPHPWVILRMEATDRCARYSQMALVAGVAERQIRLAEAMGRLLATAFDAALDGLDIPAAARQKAVRKFGEAIAELEQSQDVIEGTEA